MRTPRTDLYIYDHWSKYPMEDWRWPNFSPQELACRGTGRLAIHPETMDQLQALRTELGRPVMINSAYRSPEHNSRLSGAASRSYHMDAIAFDVSMTNHNPHAFIEAAKRHGFDGIGQYPQARNNFVHIDNRGHPASWGAPFPADQKAFAAATEDRDIPVQQDNPPEPKKTVRKPGTAEKVIGGVGLGGFLLALITQFFGG